MGYQLITRLPPPPSISSGFPENYLVPSYTPLSFDLMRHDFVYSPSKLQVFLQQKSGRKLLSIVFRGYIAGAHVKFWFHIVDDSRSKKCLKDLNEELLCCICHELIVLAHTLPCLHTFCFGCIRDWLWWDISQSIFLVLKSS